MWGNCFVWGLWRWFTRRGYLRAVPSATGGWWCHVHYSADGVEWFEFAASEELRQWWMSQPLLRWAPPLIYRGQVQRVSEPARAGDGALYAAICPRAGDE